MRIRPLNDTVIVEPETEMVAIDESQKVLDAVNKGLILLPDKNSMMKISNKARVISYGPGCEYKFKPNQTIIYDQFADSPVWHIDGKNRYRFIKYHYISAVYE